MDFLSNTYVLIAALVLVVALIVLLVLMRRKPGQAAGKKKDTAPTSRTGPKDPGAAKSANLLQAKGQAEAASALSAEEQSAPESISEWIPLLPKDLAAENAETATASTLTGSGAAAIGAPAAGVAAAEAAVADVPVQEPETEEATKLAPEINAPSLVQESPTLEGEPTITDAPHLPILGPEHPPLTPPVAAPLETAPGSLYDPVGAAISSLLQNEGELTPSEMRRLDLYKPERIIQVVEERKSGTARQRAGYAARLRAIESYALALLAGAADAIEQAPAPAPAAAGSDHMETTGEAAPPSEAERAASAVTDEVTAETAIPVPADANSEEALIAPATAIGESLFQAPQPSTSPEPTEPTPEATAVPIDEMDEPESVPEETGFVGDFAYQPEEVEPLELEEIEPVDIADEWPPEAEATEVPDASRASETTETPPQRPELESQIMEQTLATPRPQADAPLTAQQVIALPAPDLIRALPKMEAPELEKVFAQAESTEIKKGVIDRLGTLQSGDALLALQSCLDDPDPGIQVYALETAEKLLGNKS